MAFLAPLFLVGLAALALPVLLHLQKQRPKETVSFSTLMFFDEHPPITTRRSRLQDILLLILRCLALALLILAFARPFFPAKEDAPPPEGSAMHFFLIDTSATMRGEPLEKAIAATEAAIKALPADDTIALATYADRLNILLDPERARTLIPGERKSTALSLLGEAKATWQATRLDAAILSAIAAAGSDLPLNLHLVGDLQKGSAIDRLRGESWPDQLRVVLHPIERPAPWTNAGVRVLSPDRQQQRIRVTNSEGSAESDFQLSWSGIEEKTTISVAPGESAIFNAPEGVPAEGKVTLTGDSFDFDNEAAWATPTLPVVKIWHPDPSDAADTTESAYFLHRAMQPTAEYTVEVTATVPAEAPALTITDGRLPDAAPLRQLLDSGGTALLTLRDAASAQLLTTLLGVTGEATEATVRDHARFGQIDFKSSVFAPFADARYSDFSGIRIWKYRVLPDALTEPGKILARYDSGDPAWISYPVGEGTLHVLTTTWRPADSQLALTTKFAPLLHSLLADTGYGRGVYFVGHHGLETPGIHDLDGRRVAIQLDPSESELTPFTEADFRLLGLPLDAPDPQATTELAANLSSVEQESRQRIGWWLLTVAALVFFIETALAAFTGRRAIPATA